MSSIFDKDSRLLQSSYVAPSLAGSGPNVSRRSLAGTEDASGHEFTQAEADTIFPAKATGLAGLGLAVAAFAAFIYYKNSQSSSPRSNPSAPRDSSGQFVAPRRRPSRKRAALSSQVAASLPRSQKGRFMKTSAVVPERDPKTGQFLK